ncbi:MAG: exodeoxyribonuclease VII large subunit [Bacteroidales bacterium]|nr:exodeoxyribonuclease VII large subunit [Bacteroidales bacterium]
MPNPTDRERFNDKPIFSLSEICNSIQAVVSKTYNQRYYIKAEIIKLNYYPRNGHCFPELVEKENEVIKAQMRAIIWAADFRRINERFQSVTGEPLKDGINILCLATVEFSPQYGLALYIQDIEPSYTLGEMAKNRQEVIDRLKKEKVFDANRQKILPLVPKRIAVISIETSKGYNDFIVTLKQNNWNYVFETKLFPAVLQGEKAITTIIDQLNAIEKQLADFDCVAIIRGGGGDLGFSCYDNYELAHKVATFPMPILSGIGHSTNETITELVSYTYKITPTEVAYFLIQKFHDFAIQVQDFQDRIVNAARKRMEDDHNLFEKYSKIVHVIGGQTIGRHKDRISDFSKQLTAYSRQILVGQLDKCKNYQKQLGSFANQCLMNQKNQQDLERKKLIFLSKQLVEQQQEKLNVIAKQVELLHPDNVLKRGFSITYANGKAVVDASDLAETQEITTKLFNGTLTSVITKIK